MSCAGDPEVRYFMGRMHESAQRAGASADSVAKLVHYELAGRYGLAALAALAAAGQRSGDGCRGDHAGR